MLIRDVRIQFEDANSFLEEYECSLYSGWIFVPSEGPFEIGEPLEITLDLDFCSRSVRVLGVVKSRIDRALAQMLQRPSGAVVEFADGIEALGEMMRDTIAGLAESQWKRPDRAAEARRKQHRMVSFAQPLESRTLRADHRAQDWSLPGTMLEVAGLDLRVGEQIALQMIDPRTGHVVALHANVVQARDETSPLERSPGAARARAAESRPRAGISGNLSGLSFPSLLQSIATSSARGTMDIIRPGFEAHLLFESNRLRYAALGKLEGVKVLARLLEWPEGEFSFEPTIRDGEPERPLVSIESALMEATHQVDELRRLHDALLPQTILVEKSEAGQAFELSETEAAVLNHLTRPRPPTALLDSLPHADAEIWRALLGLIERGFVRVREDGAKRRSGVRGQPRTHLEPSA